MVGLDADATAALDRLRAAVDEVQLKVFLEAGDLLVVDNQVAVHGRSPFTPRFDGTDRWLQRTFVVSDLASSAQDRIGRIIDTRFVG
jgi:alpha-ketoglutarate-dependent taurine dioxygenase